jgi:uncharacterized membrane protein
MPSRSPYGVDYDADRLPSGSNDHHKVIDVVFPRVPLRQKQGIPYVKRWLNQRERSGATMILLCAALLGIVAGLRSMLAPAAVGWAIRLGLISVAGTPLAFMGYKYTAFILTALAIVELIADKLPTTPSRKQPGPFGARIVSGALVGATVGASSQSLWLGLIAGIIGAILGTLGGAAIRGKLAAAFGKDLPAALTEDVAGIVLAVVAVMRVK